MLCGCFGDDSRKSSVCLIFDSLVPFGVSRTVLSSGLTRLSPRSRLSPTLPSSIIRLSPIRSLKGEAVAALGVDGDSMIAVKSLIVVEVLRMGVVASTSSSVSLLNW